MTHTAIDGFLDTVQALLAPYSLPHYMIISFTESGVLFDYISSMPSAARTMDPTGRTLTTDIMDDLIADLVLSPEILSLVVPEDRERIKLQLWNNVLVLRVMEHDNAGDTLSVFLGVRTLDTTRACGVFSNDTGPDTNTPPLSKVLGPVAGTMTPGQEIVLWDTTSSFHGRMDCMRRVPGIQALAEEIAQKTRQRAACLHLVRFPGIALVTNRRAHLAWIALAA